MLNRNKITLLADEKLVYKAEKDIYQALQAFIVIILLFCVYTLIYKFIPGTNHPVIYSHILFGIVLAIVFMRVYSLYKAEITDLIFTDKRIQAASHFAVEDIEYKDIYDISINRNKHKLSIYLFNGKVYIYSNFKYNKTLLKLIKEYCPHLSRDEEKDKY